MSSFIFVGLDSNGHSPLWGPEGSKVDKIGEMVEGVLCEGGLLVLNSQDSPPTFCSYTGQKTWIDVSAASPALVACVSEWAVWDHVEVLFDHRLIVAQMLFQARRTDVCWMRNWRSVQWDQFNALLWRTLDQNLWYTDLEDAEAMEGAVASITDSVQRVIDALVLLKRVCRYSRVGWTPESTILRRRVASARRRWLRTGRMGAKEDFLQSRRLFCMTLS